MGGRKEEILGRLVESNKNNIAVSAMDEIEKHDTCLASLPPMAYWKPLTLSTAPVPEPINEDGSLWPPTELEAKTPNAKMDSLKHSSGLSLVGPHWSEVLEDGLQIITNIKE